MKGPFQLAVAIVVVVVLLVVFVDSTEPAKPATVSQWEGVAGAANRTCYDHGGVKQLVFRNNGIDTTVICMNNWAYSLPDW